MPKISGPRKQRTRQHVIADLSVHHLERFILEEGHTAQRLSQDYGYDLVLFTYNERGFIEPGMVLFQLKAAERLATVGSDYVFDLDIRDYHLWILERAPVVLVLYDASRRRACWLAVQNHFRSNPALQPRRGTKTVRVHVAASQVVNRRAIAKLRDLKWKTHGPVLGVMS